MTIRDRYVDIVEGIAERAGVPSPARHYRISASATRRVCIQYALQYVVRHDTLHYRYDRYRSALCFALNQGAVQAANTGTLLHVDIGCGPGLFTWVVRDLLRQAQLAVELYGYDHSTEMVRLAEEIWDELDEPFHGSWHDAVDEMLATVAEGSNYDYSLMTFGHVLAQTHDQEDAIQSFAQIIADVVTVNCLVVAVDAHGAGPSFREGCDSLSQSLLAHDLTVDVIRRWGSCFVANVAR